MPETLQATKEHPLLDTRGLLCPYPFIQAKQALQDLPRGSEIEILTDSEPTATSSVPILCEQNGYSFTSAREGDLWRLVVRKP
ncbi:MAG TPA: sulfurtransferase TusA family protein [Thermoplasmata archaeon]|nr:sulfurtransferase TusA family protein [Thermoplasmata archaeon]